MNKYIAVFVVASALSVASCGKTVTTRVHTEETRKEPVKEVVVERRTGSTIDGEQTEERIVHERVVPHTVTHWSDHETTTEK